jgi:hypothetical protein
MGPHSEATARWWRARESACGRVKVRATRRLYDSLQLKTRMSMDYFRRFRRGPFDLRAGMTELDSVTYEVQYLGLITL